MSTPCNSKKSFYPNNSLLCSRSSSGQLGKIFLFLYFSIWLRLYSTIFLDSIIEFKFQIFHTSYIIKKLFVPIRIFHIIREIMFKKKKRKKNILVSFERNARKSHRAARSWRNWLFLDLELNFTLTGKYLK